jgi:AraC-like DNA-binding protein
MFSEVFRRRSTDIDLYFIVETATTTPPVGAVEDRCGFSSASDFARGVRKRSNATPTAYAADRRICRP